MSYLKNRETQNVLGNYKTNPKPNDKLIHFIKRNEKTIRQRHKEVPDSKLALRLYHF
jgi:hypothetical protein